MMQEVACCQGFTLVKSGRFKKKKTKQLGCSMVCGFFCCCWGGGGGVCFKRAVSGKDGIDEAGAFC